MENHYNGVGGDSSREKQRNKWRGKPLGPYREGEASLERLECLKGSVIKSKSSLGRNRPRWDWNFPSPGTGWSGYKELLATSPFCCLLSKLSGLDLSDDSGVIYRTAVESKTQKHWFQDGSPNPPCVFRRRGWWTLGWRVRSCHLGRLELMMQSSLLACLWNSS